MKRLKQAAYISLYTLSLLSIIACLITTFFALQAIVLFPLNFLLPASLLAVSVLSNITAYSIMYRTEDTWYHIAEWKNFQSNNVELKIRHDLSITDNLLAQSALAQHSLPILSSSYGATDKLKENLGVTISKNFYQRDIELQLLEL